MIVPHSVLINSTILLPKIIGTFALEWLVFSGEMFDGKGSVESNFSEAMDSHR